MKKAILIAFVVLAAVPAAFARGDGGAVTLLISGATQNSSLHISLTPDGREYVILSAAPLEVGGDICSHPEETPSELFCDATAIAGFEVNVGAGADSVAFTGEIPVPVTIRGGPGNDRLIGGGTSDKIIGGPGHDLLVGRRGDDWIFGGSGPDKILGGPGNDQLRGGPSEDSIVGGPGKNEVLP